jgi:hypothetical protein
MSKSLPLATMAAITTGHTNVPVRLIFREWNGQRWEATRVSSVTESRIQEMARECLSPLSSGDRVFIGEIETGFDAGRRIIAEVA